MLKQQDLNYNCYLYIKHWAIAIIVITIIFLCLQLLGNNITDYNDCNIYDIIYPETWKINNTPAYPPPLINFMD
jgi:hypothetical protein